MHALISTWHFIVDATRPSWTGSRPDDHIAYSWARVIASYEDVPARYAAFFEPLREQGRPFPYTVLTPNYRGFLHMTTEKLLSLRDDGINILEEREDAFERTFYPLNGLYGIEFASILLSSRFVLRGLSDRGTPTGSTLKFNSITDHVFAPVLTSIRSMFPACLPAFPEGEVPNQELASRLSFKFRNYLKRGLLPGDGVLHAIMQPEIRSIRFSFLGKKIQRTISPSCLLLLTQREVIFIREEVRRGDKTRYGGVWNYLPLERIQSLSIQKRENGLIGLSILLPDDIRWDLLFQPSVEPELINFLDIVGKRGFTSP